MANKNLWDRASGSIRSQATKERNARDTVDAEYTAARNAGKGEEYFATHGGAKSNPDAGKPRGVK